MVTIICSDKTGTLTENRMTVTLLDVAGEEEDLTSSQHQDFVNAEVATDAAISSLLQFYPELGLLLTGQHSVMMPS